MERTSACTSKAKAEVFTQQLNLDVKGTVIGQRLNPGVNATSRGAKVLL
jgi:hypothetical protein